MLRRLNALSAGTQVGQDLLDAVLVDNPKAFVGNTQTHETFLGLDPKAPALQIWQKAAAGPVFRVGNVVAALRPLRGKRCCRSAAASQSLGKP
jgi:hypothetical protein